MRQFISGHPVEHRGTDAKRARAGLRQLCSSPRGCLTTSTRRFNVTKPETGVARRRLPTLHLPQKKNGGKPCRSRTWTGGPDRRAACSDAGTTKFQAPWLDVGYPGSTRDSHAGKTKPDLGAGGTPSLHRAGDIAGQGHKQPWSSNARITPWSDDIWALAAPTTATRTVGWTVNTAAHGPRVRTEKTNVLADPGGLSRSTYQNF